MEVFITLVVIIVILGIAHYFDNKNQNNQIQQSYSHNHVLNKKIYNSQKSDTGLNENFFNNFSDDYLNTQLEDGLTIKEHMQLDYKKATAFHNKNFPKEINNEYKFLIENMRSSVVPSPDNFNRLNYFEEIFIKTFLEKVKTIRKKYYISLIRYADEHIMIQYNGCQVGRFQLSKNPFWIQSLRGAYNNIQFDNLSFEECLEKIDYYLKYIKYHLKEPRI